LNKSRENSISYSTYTTISRGDNSNHNFNKFNTQQKAVTPSNANLRLRKEIETFSKSLQENVKGTHVNRPPIYLNKPEFELDHQKYLEFSPTQNKKNLMVSSNLLRNFGSSSHYNTQNNPGYNFISKPLEKNEISEKNEKFFNFPQSINSYNHKPKEASNNFINMNFSSKNSKTVDNSYNPVQTTQSGFKLSFNDKKSNTATRTITIGNESVEDFGKEFTNGPKKESYIEKYSLKKKNKEA
jgi:hypothetical protein